jgi:hypothetical protein
VRSIATTCGLLVAALAIGSCSAEPHRDVRGHDRGSEHAELGSPTQTLARVHAPAHADGAVALEDSKSGLVVSFALEGARSVEARPDGEAIVYEGGGPRGSDWTLRSQASGVEDYVRFATRPERERVAYRIDVSHVAGLRRIGDVVEFLDGGGAPRLRVAAPWIEDASGRRAPLAVSLDGCAYDADPREPWGRPVTPPGAASCELTLDWSAAHVTYPAVVDPAWTSTGQMISARDAHASVVLPNGRVLVVGVPFCCLWTSAEIYDPATATWSASNAPGSRRGATAHLLGSGQVLVIGGEGSSATTSALYSLSSGTWTSMAMPRQHVGHASAVLTTGDASCPAGCGQCACGDGVCAAGETCTTCLTDCGACPFCGDGTCAATEMGNCASDCGSLKCGDGECKNETCTSCSLDCGVCAYCGDGVCAGGETCASCADDCGACGCGAVKVLAIGGNGSPISPNVDLFDAATQTWTPTGPLATGRFRPTASTLPSGDVLVAGGSNGGALASVEIYHPASGTFTPGAPMATARVWHTATTLLDARVLVAGGETNQVEIYDPASGAWAPGPSMGIAREVHAASLLKDGRVLVTGGLAGILLDDTSEVFDPGASTWLPAGKLTEGRAYHTTTTLPDGRVLATGGGDGTVSVYPNDCSANAELWSPLAQGLPCTQPGECASLRCVDGVCCDQPCTGACQACSASAKGGGVDGVCGPASTGSPDPLCPVAPPSSCGTTGLCGVGACAVAALGSACGPASCAAGVLTASTCDAQAACVVAPQSCAPYACADATACATSCNDDAQCAPAAFCDPVAHVCVAEQPNGAPCTAGSECASGFCVEGVCCESACNGVCQACTAANKASAVDDGVCDAAANGLDPHDDCTDQGIASCQLDGLCNGQGACRQYPAGAACGATVCVGSEQTGAACNGTGACIDDAVTECAPYACVSATCGAGCGVAEDCVVDAWCDAGVCVFKSEDGTACSSDLSCLGNLCVDGVCCNAPCAGQCEACDVPGAEGSCVPVSGAPHGDRPACAAGTAEEPCLAATCNGVVRDSCAALAGNDVVCRPGSCEDGVATLQALCDAAGQCGPEQQEECAPYACAASACALSCVGDADCAAGSHCDAASGACVLGAACADDDTLVAPSGLTTECAPYRCVEGACKTGCESVLDCVSPSVCDEGGACVGSTDAADDGGCGCRVGGRRPAAPLGAAVALLVIAAVRLRRRGVRAGVAALGAGVVALVGAAAPGCADDPDVGPAGPASRPDAPPRSADPGDASEAALSLVREIDAVFDLHRRATHALHVGRDRSSDALLRHAGSGHRGAAWGGHAGDPAWPSGAVDGAQARVELPDVASGRFRVEDEASGVAVEVALRGAGDPRAEHASGRVVYDGALEGAVWAHTPAANGTEDVILFRSRPALEEISYAIDVSPAGRVAGLRLVGGSLEMLDASGAPRLRVASAALLDAAGVRHEARLSVEGCAFDADPRAPWGRAVIAPGAAECTLRVAWAGSPVAYPAVLDPAWTTTGSMAAPHFYHGAVRLADGRVLVVSGLDTATAELYDPSTGTWAATGGVAAKRWNFGAVRLANNRVLVAGGIASPATSPALTTAEIYDPATGVFTATGPLAQVRVQSEFAALAGGDALAIGGAYMGLPSKTTERYVAATGTWSPTGSLAMPRAVFGATSLADGRVLATGGWGGVKECEIYDPATGAWTTTGSLAQARDTHVATLLPSGKVLATGGWPTRTDAEIFDPVAGTWSPAGALSVGRHGHAATAVGARVVVAGGLPLTDAVEVYREATNDWAPATPMSSPRCHHTATLLGNGALLFAGGGAKRSTGIRVATAELFTLVADGVACAAAGDCASGTCLGGMCCDQPCTGACVACTAAEKGSGANGVCGPIAAGADPKNGCAVDPQASCGTTGACDGAGQCAFYAAGSSCQPSTCAAGVLGAATCSGGGACVHTQKPCAPYVCADATSCSTSCASDAACAASAWCRTSDQTCQPDGPLGATCASAAQCQSGSCVEGVCCDGPCNGTCQSCTAAGKTSGADGTCGLAKAGMDPHADCADEGTAACNYDGTCDGLGACKKYSAGTACGPTSCTANTQTGYACNGTGSCLAGASVECTPYACAAGVCLTSCAGGTDCAMAFFCAGGTCVAQSKNGISCATADECLSGHCVDGFCCNGPCTEQCEACDASGGEGTCVPVSDQPHGTRPPCDLAAAGDACTAKKCDGIDRDTCVGFVGADVPCRNASCADGVQTLAAVCDESGACPDPHQKACAPYACEGAACKSSCQSDADCSAGAVCDAATQECSQGATCVDERTLANVDGTETDCAPYTCEGTACNTSCKSALDCTASTVCNASGACVPPEPPSEEPKSEEGCGCRTVGRTGDSGAMLAAAIAALLSLARRRRIRPRLVP